MPPNSPDYEREKIERLRGAMYSRSLSDKLKNRPRRTFETDESAVSDDFHTPDPGVAQTVVAPRTIGLARTALWWILAGAVFFFIAAVGFFAYYFLLGGGSLNASAGNIDISVSGPPQIQSGEPVELQLVITNRNAVPLNLADLVITYPAGTRSPADFTTELPSQRISLGTIESGGTRQGTVSAVFAGAEGERADIKVELEYRIPGSSAVFIAPSNYAIVFASSPLSLSVGGNSETTSGQPVQFTVTVASNASAPVSDVLMNAQYPFGFKQTSATPAADASGLWKLGTLYPGQKTTVTIQGVLSGEQGDSRVFHFTAGTRASSTSSSVTTPLSQNSFTMTISKPFLGLSLSVNGASGSNAVVSPGDTVTVAIAWQNNLPTALTNAVIVARLTGIVIDGSTVRSSDGFYRSSDGVMLWDKTTDSTLSDVSPSARGTVSFSFQVPNSDALKNVVNPYINISVNGAGSRLSETGVPQNLQAATSQRIAVASDLELVAQGLYYANPFGSTGPLPPKAGTETTYAIVFTVTNTTNKVSGAAVKAALPPYVRWVGIYSPNTEKIYFDSKLYSQGQVLTPPPGDPCQGTTGICWSLGDIEPGAGLNGTPPRQAAVAIGFTPSTSQIGQQPPLIQGVSLSGKDAATNVGVFRSAPDVTTNISSDPGFSTANAEVVK